MKKNQGWRTRPEPRRTPTPPAFFLKHVDNELIEDDDPCEMPVIVEVEACGEVYLLRKHNGEWLFRSRRTDMAEWTYFITGEAAAALPAEAIDLDSVLINGEFGRYMVHYAGVQSLDPWFLWFRPDGSVRARGCYEDLTADWNTPWIDDVRSAPAETMSEFGRRVFDEIVNPLLEDPYVHIDHNQEFKPIEFICGSQEELAAVTRWIIHSGGQQTQTMWPVKVGYAAKMGPEWQWDRIAPRELPARDRTLCELALEYNDFMGSYWEYQDMSFDRQSGWNLQPLCVIVSVDCPSQHERAEALLSLSEWLVGKVPTAERVALLGE